MVCSGLYKIFIGFYNWVWFYDSWISGEYGKWV